MVSSKWQRQRERRHSVGGLGGRTLLPVGAWPLLNLLVIRLHVALSELRGLMALFTGCSAVVLVLGMIILRLLSSVSSGHSLLSLNLFLFPL